MQTKTAIKVISLYDLIANNLLVIFATLHHIIILAFNYYSIEYLDKLIIDFPEYYKQFEEIQFNMEICQMITIFTAFSLYFKINIFVYNSNQIRFGIMCISGIVKVIYTLFQLYHYSDNHNNYRNKPALGLMYLIIELSYLFRILFIIMFCVIPLLIYSSIYLDKIFNYLQNWAKKYTFTYVEQTIVEKVDDV
jgi:hypothetical protein